MPSFGPSNVDNRYQARRSGATNTRLRSRCQRERSPSATADSSSRPADWRSWARSARVDAKPDRCARLRSGGAGRSDRASAMALSTRAQRMISRGVGARSSRHRRQSAVTPTPIAAASSGTEHRPHRNSATRRQRHSSPEGRSRALRIHSTSTAGGGVLACSRSSAASQSASSKSTSAAPARMAAST